MMSDWYEITENNNELQQGDFIKNCPILLLPKNIDLTTNEEINAKKGEIKLFDVIILSQSCDLKSKKIDNVLVCPFYELNYLQKKSQEFKNSKIEQIRRGYIHSMHLLNKCELKEFKSDFKIVEFKNPFSVDREYLENLICSKKRIRLKSPYKEHLSQAFARFFMRVGLPIDIPSF